MKGRVIPCKSSEISFMKIKNNNRPRTEPCGTPADINFSREKYS